jgi:hypothetical protein
LKHQDQIDIETIVEVLFVFTFQVAFKVAAGEVDFSVTEI